MRTLADPVKPPMRYRVVDADFAAVLEEHFGIPTCVMLTALEGEPLQPAVALCRIATHHQEPTGTLLMLARRFGRGRARRQRTAATPPRGHGEVSSRPWVDRPGPGRGQDIAAPRTVALELRDDLDRIATQLGVS